MIIKNEEHKQKRIPSTVSEQHPLKKRKCWRKKKLFEVGVPFLVELGNLLQRNHGSLGISFHFSSLRTPFLCFEVGREKKRGREEIKKKKEKEKYSNDGFLGRTVPGKEMSFKTISQAVEQKLGRTEPLVVGGSCGTFVSPYFLTASPCVSELAVDCQQRRSHISAGQHSFFSCRLH